MRCGNCLYRLVSVMNYTVFAPHSLKHVNFALLEAVLHLQIHATDLWAAAPSLVININVSFLMQSSRNICKIDTDEVFAKLLAQISHLKITSAPYQDSTGQTYAVLRIHHSVYYSGSKWIINTLVAHIKMNIAFSRSILLHICAAVHVLV